MVQIRTPKNQRITVNWNVQAFVIECNKVTGATNFGTYLGHSPSAERATDAFTRIPMPRSNRVLGDAIADFCLEGKMQNGVSVWRYFGLRYLIWRQRINWNDGRGWIAMGNRGDDTQNHFDHDHISFNVIPRPSSVITTPTIQGGKDMLVLNVDKLGIFLLRGDQVVHFTHPDHVMAWVRAGVPYQDKVVMPTQVFKDYTGWGSAQAQGLVGAGIDEGGDPEADAEVARQADELISAVQQQMDKTYEEYVRDLQVN